MISYLFNLIFYQPILNLLVLTYNIIPIKDMGLVIIILTIIFKLILYPFSQKTIEAQKKLKYLQPKIDAIKEKYKNEKEKQALEMMNIYKENKINPFSSCLPLLIQIPFLIAVYRVFNTGLTSENLFGIYSFIFNPGHLNTLAFGIIDLAKPQWMLAVIAGVAQFWQSKMMIAKRPEIKNKDSEDEDMAAIMSKQMLYMMPIITIVIGFNLPSGLVFYWLLITIFTGLQQLLVMKKPEKQEKSN